MCHLEVCVYVCVCMYVCMHAVINRDVSVAVLRSINVPPRGMHACMYVCVKERYTYMCNLHMYICIHMYMYMRIVRRSKGHDCIHACHDES